MAGVSNLLQYNRSGTDTTEKSLNGNDGNGRPGSWCILALLILENARNSDPVDPTGLPNYFKFMTKVFDY
jgi:hypothetical protein